MKDGKGQFKALDQMPVLISHVCGKKQVAIHTTKTGLTVESIQVA